MFLLLDVNPSADKRRAERRWQTHYIRTWWREVGWDQAP